MKHKKILVAISVIGIAVTISICAFSCEKKHEQKNQKQNSTISLEKDKKKDTSEYALSVEDFLDSKPEYKKPYLAYGYAYQFSEHVYSDDNGKENKKTTFRIKDENEAIIINAWGCKESELEEKGIFEGNYFYMLLINNKEHENGEQLLKNYMGGYPWSVRIDVDEDMDLTKGDVKLFTDPQQADQAYEELLNEYEKGKEKQ